MADRAFCHFGPCFFSLWPSYQPVKSKLSKMKKTPGDIIILHLCHTNDDYMLYGSWDMEQDRQIFLSFCVIFCPFDSENQNFEKMTKNTWTFFALLPHYWTQKLKFGKMQNVYYKWWSYDVWFQRYWAQQTEFFVISGYFLLF